MYRAQVRVREGDTFVWRDIKPSGSTTPYQYATADNARRMIERSNDGRQSWDNYRIVKVEE